MQGRSSQLLLVLCAFALLASAPVRAQCVDHDNDGYQPNSASDPNCALPKGDCNDDAPSINPGAPELCGDLIDNNCDGNVDEGFIVGTESGLPPDPSDPNARYDCNDGVDNDGDGMTDIADPQCEAAQCFLTDPPGCCAGNNEPPGGSCTAADPNGCCLTLAFLQCDSQTPSGPTICAVPPGGQLLQQPEGGVGDPSCSDAKDNNCNGLQDLAEPACQAPEVCNGIDDDASGREGPSSPSYDCNDGIDNDGDGLIDAEDPGCIAGIDDDPNFALNNVPLGGECAVGTGACERTGTVICDGSGGVACSRSPGAAGTEGPPGSLSCSDMVDNDCDGLTDFPADPDCQAVEICDGIDNNGDGLTDEGFPDLGETCFAGQGACLAQGTRICATSGTATTCDAAPGLPRQEGPTGPTCIDGIDNDCDGLVDLDDPDCGSADLAVTCSLHEIRQGRLTDCSDMREIHYRVTGESAQDSAMVTAELLALDSDGNVLASIEGVKDGDWARLTSRQNLNLVKARTRDLSKRFQRPRTGGKTPRPGTLHDVTAPIPLLRVTARDGMKEAVAYCSNVPYVQVIRPDEAVETAAQSAVTHVLTAIPRIAQEKIQLYIDGEEIIHQINAGPDLYCPAVAPCSGTATVGQQTVRISDLVIDTKPIEKLSSNTLRMDISGLGCGAHTIAVQGEERNDAFPLQPARRCVEDDLKDTGSLGVFEITLDGPVSGSSGNPVPTPVTGEVCHGRPIAELRINGKEIDTSGQQATTLDPNTPFERTTYRLPIDTRLGQTDLARDLKLGDVPPGTFDAGSNRVIADAQDDLGNRAFNTVIFATGSVANPGTPGAAVRPGGAPGATGDGIAGTSLGTSGRIRLPVQDAPMSVAPKSRMDFDLGGSGPSDPAEAAQWKKAIEDAFHGEYDQEIKNAWDETYGQILPRAATPGVAIPNAFVVGIKSSAIERIFKSKCARAAIQFRDRVRSKILSKPPTTKKISVPCSCDPTIVIQPTSVSIDASQFTCPVSFTNGKFSVTINLPDVHIYTSVYGSCTTRDPIFGACIARSVVSGSVETQMNNVHMSFNVTESQLMGNPNPEVPFFDPGGVINIDAGASVDIQCIGGDLCEGVVTVLTFGQVDLSPDVDVSGDLDFNREVGSGKPDPIDLDQVKIDEATVMQFDQEAKGTLSSVKISPQGIVAGLEGRFKTSKADPTVVSTPGAVLTPNTTLPSPAAPGTGDVFLAISDDVFNQLFASMRIAGKLNSGCRDSGRTVGDILPFDCSTLAAASPGGTATVQGLCHGIRGDDCEAFAGPDLLETPLLQGICHGTQGDNCTAIPRGLAGTAWPADCSTVTFSVPGADPNGSSGPAQATALLQGICHGTAGDDCELLAGADGNLTAIEQGACHAAAGEPCQGVPTVLATGAKEKGTCAAVAGGACGLLPVAQRIACLTASVITGAADSVLDFAERKACEITPARDINIGASDPLLFCTTTDMPPRLLIQDDPSTPEVVETGIRLNDLSVAMLVDRNASTSPGLDGALSATPGCFDPGAPTTGDCLLYGVCLDLNFVTDMRFDNKICAAGKPGLKTNVRQLQTTVRQQGVVCGAPTATADDLLTAAGATDSTIDVLKQNVDMFTPPSCANGFDLSENLQYGPATFKLVAIDTDPNSDPNNTLQEYIAITGLVAP